MPTDVIVGAWRNGMDKALASQVQTVEERREKGFRQLPYESTVSELTLMLDAYDALLNEILTEDKESSKWNYPDRMPEPPSGYCWTADADNKVRLVLNTLADPLPFYGELDEATKSTEESLVEAFDRDLAPLAPPSKKRRNITAELLEEAEVIKEATPKKKKDMPDFPVSEEEVREIMRRGAELRKKNPRAG